VIRFDWSADPIPFQNPVHFAHPVEVLYILSEHFGFIFFGRTRSNQVEPGRNGDDPCLSCKVLIVKRLHIFARHFEQKHRFDPPSPQGLRRGKPTLTGQTGKLSLRGIDRGVLFHNFSIQHLAFLFTWP
jgi:hypothetical protein